MHHTSNLGRILWNPYLLIHPKFITPTCKIMKLSHNLSKRNILKQDLKQPRSWLDVYTSKARLGGVIEHSLWNFLVSSSFPTHKLPFNRFGFGTSYLIEANQEDGIVFLWCFSLLFLSASSSKNEGEWSQFGDKKVEQLSWSMATKGVTLVTNLTK